MATSFKKQEIQVVDDKLLLEGILISTPKSGSNATKGDLSLVDLAPTTEVLTMSFKNIGRIENLVGFENLTKLCLDNNCIQEIVNLDHLVNLRWLDLSFNKISVIDGLSKLAKLEDLSLYSNRVSEIKGLECCQNLQCLSLGSNAIESIDQVTRLRQLKSLRMLTLKGNPIYKEPEYKNAILAYVDGLKYIDYELVDSNELHIAKEQYHDELIDIEEKESVADEKASRDKIMLDLRHKLQQAGIEFSLTLFEDMFLVDADLEKLKHLPGIKDLCEQFRADYKELSDTFNEMAMETDASKKREVADFEKVINGIRTKDDEESTQLIANFEKAKKAALASLQQQNRDQNYEPDAVYNAEKHNVITRLLNDLENVGDELMTIELRQVEKFDALVDEFDNRMNDIKNQCIDKQQSFFRGVEELENNFSANLRNVATDLVERAARDELAENFLDDEGLALIQDKDICMATLSGSHDMHIGKILKREDEARAIETKRYQDCVFGYNNTERNRNRDRILQIHDLMRSTKESLSKYLSSEEDEGGFDEDLAA